MKKYFFLFFLLIFIACEIKTNDKAKTESPYKNLNSNATYVGMQTCRGCHQDIYNTFIETGMGKSWDLATPKKSSARFGNHEVVYDTLMIFIIIHSGKTIRCL